MNRSIVQYVEINNGKFGLIFFKNRKRKSNKNFITFLKFILFSLWLILQFY